MARFEIEAVSRAAHLGESKNGSPQVATTWETDKGQKTFYLSLKGGALQYTVEKLRTGGWVGDDLDDLSSFNGKQVILVIEEGTYEGKPTEELKFVNIPGRGRKPAPAGLAASLRASIAALAPPTPDPFE